MSGKFTYAKRGANYIKTLKTELARHISPGVGNFVETIDRLTGRENRWPNQEPQER